MLEVTIQLDELRCISQFDGNGASEPYMWVNFFHVDTGTITSNNAGGVVATRNMLDGLSCRQNFSSSVRAGTVVSIPELVGKFRIMLDDSVLKTPAVGLVFAVLEENETSDNLMRIGHHVFGVAFHEEINNFVSEHLPDVPSITPEEEKAMAKRIQDRVFSAVRDNASILKFECFNIVGFDPVTFLLHSLEVNRGLDEAIAASEGSDMRSVR